MTAWGRALEAAIAGKEAADNVVRLNQQTV
jgi:hypothetical protein